MTCFAGVEPRLCIPVLCQGSVPFKSSQGGHTVRAVFPGVRLLGFESLMRATPDLELWERLSTPPHLLFSHGDKEGVCLMASAGYMDKQVINGCSCKLGSPSLKIQDLKRSKTQNLECSRMPQVGRPTPTLSITKRIQACFQALCFWNMNEAGAGAQLLECRFSMYETLGLNLHCRIHCGRWYRTHPITELGNRGSKVMFGYAVDLWPA